MQLAFESFKQRETRVARDLANELFLLVEVHAGQIVVVVVEVLARGINPPHFVIFLDVDRWCKMNGFSLKQNLG